jgi:hypothetical protein
LLLAGGADFRLAFAGAEVLVEVLGVEVADNERLGWALAAASGIVEPLLRLSGAGRAGGRIALASACVVVVVG